MLCGISASCDVCKLWICTVQVRAVLAGLGWAGLDWRWRSGEYELWDVSGLLLGCWIGHFSVVSVDLVGY